VGRTGSEVVSLVRKWVLTSEISTGFMALGSGRQSERARERAREQERESGRASERFDQAQTLSYIEGE